MTACWRRLICRRFGNLLLYIFTVARIWRRPGKPGRYNMVSSSNGEHTLKSFTLHICFVIYFTSLQRFQTKTSADGHWMTNMNRFWWNLLPWPNRGTTNELAWKDWGKPQKNFIQDNRWPSRDSNRSRHPKYKSLERRHTSLLGICILTLLTMAGNIGHLIR
jgi:hypothetical protein